MVNSSKDIQLSELKDLVSQLNTTIKTLNDTIARQQVYLSTENSVNRSLKTRSL